MHRIPSPRTLMNYAIRTLGHANLSAPLDIWRRLGTRGYQNELFSVMFNEEDNTVRFDTEPWRSTHLMMGMKYAKGGVALTAPLIKDNDDRYVLNGMATNLPARWLSMLYEYSLSKMFYNAYSNILICDSSDISLSSNYGPHFDGLCSDYELAMVAKYEKIHSRDRRCETLDAMNEEYGQRFNSFSDEDFNRNFFDVSTRSDLFPYRLVITKGPVATEESFDRPEYVGRMVNVDDEDDSREWRITTCSSSPSAALFSDICRSAPNDYRRYDTDVNTTGGGITLPHSRYRMASIMISNMSNTNHPHYPFDLNMSNHFLPTGSVTAEDLVVLAEDVRKCGGRADFV